MQPNRGRTKGIVASSKAETPGDGSKPYRAFLYGCLVHLLEHTQGDARLDWSGLGEAEGRPETSLVRECWCHSLSRNYENPSMRFMDYRTQSFCIMCAIVSDSLRLVVDKTTSVPFLLWRLERPYSFPPILSYCALQSHEALREGHRLQNRELLREQIEPLAHLLNDDARSGKKNLR